MIAIASEGDDTIAERAGDVVYVPDLGEYLTAVLVTILRISLIVNAPIGHRERSGATLDGPVFLE